MLNVGCHRTLLGLLIGKVRDVAHVAPCELVKAEEAALTLVMGFAEEY